MKLFKQIWEILKTTFKDWNARDVSTDANGLSYSAIFSIPGLLIIIIWVAGIFFGEEAVRGQVTQSVGRLMGTDVGTTVENLIVSGMVDNDNIWMKIIGIGSLVFGATNLFFQLQKSLNRLWDIQAAPNRAWYKFLIDRASSLGLILIIGFLLLITLVLSSFIGLANDYLTSKFNVETQFLVYFLNFGIGFIVTMVLFAMMFKVLPDVELKWRSVWTGAFFTTILFTIGKFLLTYYFNEFKPTSAFGGAGTVILVMMWFNYTCQLIFFGAEFTKVYANEMKHEVKLSKHAKWATQTIQTGESSDVVTGVEVVENSESIINIDKNKKEFKDSGI